MSWVRGIIIVLAVFAALSEVDLPAFSDLPPPFLCALCVKSFAFICVHLRSSVVPLTTTAEPANVTTAVPPKTAPTAAIASPAPRTNPAPSKPSPPDPPQYPAKPPTHATPDKSPSSAPDPCPRFSPALPKIAPHPECRPPPETGRPYS